VETIDKINHVIWLEKLVNRYFDWHRSEYEQDKMGERTTFLNEQIDKIRKELKRYNIPDEMMDGFWYDSDDGARVKLYDYFTKGENKTFLKYPLYFYDHWDDDDGDIPPTGVSGEEGTAKADI